MSIIKYEVASKTTYTLPMDSETNLVLVHEPQHNAVSIEMVLGNGDVLPLFNTEASSVPYALKEILTSIDQMQSYWSLENDKA